MQPALKKGALVGRVAGYWHGSLKVKVSDFDPIFRDQSCRPVSHSLLHGGQGVGVAGQEPAAVGLSAVDREAMPGELLFFPAGARGHGERVPAPRVGEFADDHDLDQLAAAIDPPLLVGRREGGGKYVPAERFVTRIEKNDIVRHQGEQTGKIAGIDGIDPGGMDLGDGLFGRSHRQSPCPMISRGPAERQMRNRPPAAVRLARNVRKSAQAAGQAWLDSLSPDPPGLTPGHCLPASTA